MTKHINSKKNKLQIRNSTAEFLIFTSQAGEDSIEVMVSDENVWLTQDMIATLYKKGRSTIAEHLKNIFSDEELDENSVCRKFRRTGPDDKEYNTKFYSLEAVIAVGFRTNSDRAIVFRQWANNVLKDFSIRGYVLDKERLKNGAFLNEEYFDHLLEEIREIRASAEKENMGLSTWKNSPKGKILKSDVSVAKNYLSLTEMDSLNRIVTMYLDYAENQAKRRIPITMEDWANKLNAFL